MLLLEDIVTYFHVHKQKSEGTAIFGKPLINMLF